MSRTGASTPWVANTCNAASSRAARFRRASARMRFSSPDMRYRKASCKTEHRSVF